MTSPPAARRAPVEPAAPVAPGGGRRRWPQGRHWTLILYPLAGLLLAGAEALRGLGWLPSGPPGSALPTALGLVPALGAGIALALLGAATGLRRWRERGRGQGAGGAAPPCPPAIPPVPGTPP